MYKKKIPIWSSEVLVCATTAQPNSELIHVDESFLIMKTQSHSYVVSRLNGQTQKLPIAIHHVVQRSAEEFYFLTIGENKRYQVHLYNVDNGQLESISVKSYSPMLKKTAKLFIDSQSKHLYLIGGEAVSKYEIYRNSYCFNSVQSIWQDSSTEEEGLRNLIESPNSLLYSLSNMLYVLLSNNDLVYTELFVFLLGVPLKLVESRQLKHELKFKSLPKISVCEETGEVYFFDLTNLYRQNNDLIFSRLNRAVFLSEPIELALLSCQQNELNIFSLKSQSISRQWIHTEELQELNTSADNIPLSFYFNKQAFSDLVFSIQDREIHCSKLVFEFYSRKFKKIITDQKQQKNKTVIKLQLKFPTFYFLVQQLYNQFRTELKFDEETMFELLIFSNKFQIDEFQRKCQDAITITLDNFEQLYDFYRNVETFNLSTRLFKHFVSNYKELARVLPVGKVEEIVRCLYQPQCQHINVVELKAQLGGDIRIKRKEKVRLMSKMATLQGFLENQILRIQICEKCNHITNAAQLLN